jgi:hypothetical protein
VISSVISVEGGELMDEFEVDGSIGSLNPRLREDTVAEIGMAG